MEQIVQLGVGENLLKMLVAWRVVTCGLIRYHTFIINITQCTYQPDSGSQVHARDASDGHRS